MCSRCLVSWRFASFGPLWISGVGAIPCRPAFGSGHGFSTFNCLELRFEKIWSFWNHLQIYRFASEGRESLTSFDCGGSFGLSPRPFAANTLAREPCCRFRIITVKNNFCIVLVFTKFHFFSLSPFGLWVLLCFRFWVFRQSSCSNFALARCISRVDYSGGHCGWNSVAQALVASWLQKWCWKSALQPECQVLRTVKNKTPRLQLLPQNCKRACTKILKKYTRRASFFLKLHSFPAAALKVFPNWSSSWCCWSAGQNAVYMESKSTLKV